MTAPTNILKPGITAADVDKILADMVNQTMQTALETAAKVAEKELARLGVDDGGAVAAKIRKLKAAGVK